MKCSVKNCQHVYQKGGQYWSFHRFPHNPNVLTTWVAATGIPNFIPTHTSKICSAHFEDFAYSGLALNRKLKPEAVPTKLLTEDASRRVSEYMERFKEINPVACILGTDTPMKQVAIVRDKAIPIPKSATVSTLSQPPPVTTAPASTIKVVDMKKLLQPTATAAVQDTSTSKPNVNKLSNSNSLIQPKKDKHEYMLESFVNHTGITVSQVLTCLKVILPGKFDFSRMIPNEKVASLVIRYLKLDEKSVQNQNVVQNHLKTIIEAVKAKHHRSGDFAKHPYTKVSDSDLKHALGMILPESFSMTDITDEVLALICITLNLDVYSDAYYILISKIRKFTSEGQKFSEILNCDSKVDDTTLESNEDPINNIETGYVNLIPNQKEIITNELIIEDQKEITTDELTMMNEENSADSNVVCSEEQKSELVFVDVNNPEEICQESADLKPSIEQDFSQSSEISLTRSGRKTVRLGILFDSDDEKETSKVYKCKKKKSNLDLDWEPELMKEFTAKKKSNVDLDWEPELTKEPELPKEPTAKRKGVLRDINKIDVIVKYLHQQKCSARGALTDYHNLFELCRHLHLRPRSYNLKEMELKLNYILEHNININNVEYHLQKFRDKQLSSTSTKKPSTSDKSQNAMRNTSDRKLKMKPIVVIQDVLDYRPDQLSLVRKKKVKSNGFHNQVTYSLKQSLSNKKNSPEQVKKITEDSYKKFRRICFKINGTKAFPCVKYSKLAPGTEVYAKNFRHPAIGWVKGVIVKSEGPMVYQVKLDNKSQWTCTVNQLRPLPIKGSDGAESQATHRSHRPIKPKQLFDL